MGGGVAADARRSARAFERDPALWDDLARLVVRGERPEGLLTPAIACEPRRVVARRERSDELRAARSPPFTPAQVRKAACCARAALENDSRERSGTPLAAACGRGRRRLHADVAGAGGGDAAEGHAAARAPVAVLEALAAQETRRATGACREATLAVATKVNETAENRRRSPRRSTTGPRCRCGALAREGAAAAAARARRATRPIGRAATQSLVAYSARSRRGARLPSRRSATSARGGGRRRKPSAYHLLTGGSKSSVARARLVARHRRRRRSAQSTTPWPRRPPPPPPPPPPTYREPGRARPPARATLALVTAPPGPTRCSPRRRARRRRARRRAPKTPAHAKERDARHPPKPGAAAARSLRLAYAEHLLATLGRRRRGRRRPRLHRRRRGTGRADGGAARGGGGNGRRRRRRGSAHGAPRAPVLCDGTRRRRRRERAHDAARRLPTAMPLAALGRRPSRGR